MKSVYRLLSPLLLGVVMFNCIRFTTDLLRHDTLWAGSMRYHLNALFLTILMCYVFDLDSRYFLSRIRPKWNISVFSEYLFMTVKVLVVLNLVLIVGDRLDVLYMGNIVSDYVVANVIYLPLYLLYYIILRTNKVETDYQRQSLQLEKMRSDQLEMELKFLKSQYHPHFLFNAMNTAYFQIEEKNLLPRRTLEMISELLRYQLYGGNQKVSVQEEINYMRTYIELQTLRMSERLKLHVDFPSGLEHLSIYPLLFLPLIENAFKYVGGAYELDIQMGWESDWIILETRNSIPELPLLADCSNNPNKGIGLENLRRRLSLLYPDKHQLVVEVDGKEFTAKLMIQIDQP